MPSRRRFSITTMGCQMNVHDSERLDSVLRRAGYEASASAKQADVVVVNTCSVREKAVQKLRSEVGRLIRLKRERPDEHLTIVVAGCVAQQEGERLVKWMPGIDIVIGPDNIAELPTLLSQQEIGGLPQVRTVFDNDAPQFLSAEPAPMSPARQALGAGQGSVTSFVTTMKGCNERCSFCIVPYTRGSERYRPSAEVIGEIEALVSGTTREVTLLGQTVNSYRDPSAALPPAPAFDPSDPDESEFAALLRDIAARVPNLRRLRYTSPHPRHLTPSLIRAHAELEVLTHHVHMPVQSGSDRVLKRMIRRYRREEYVQRVTALREAVAGLTLSTDIIVGFPGETDEDFEETLSLVAEVGFVGLYGFKYSPRPFTPALKLDDDVPEEVKSERLTRLFDLSESLIRDHLGTLIGTAQRVLLEGEGRSAGGSTARSFVGRTERNEIVHLADARAAHLVGEEVDVVIEGAYKHSLRGQLTDVAIVEASRRASAASQTRVASSTQAARQRRALPVVS